MAGLYIHIPFCKQKCHYCNFYTVVSKKYRPDFISVLLKELEQRQGYLDDPTIDTIYFGGGTPSLLTADEVIRIINRIRELFTVSKKAEITLEANPDDLDENKIKSLRNETPVNRLSIGVQSFFDDDLSYLNRVHSSLQAEKTIENSLKAGFDNITIDLIYGIPTLTVQKWKENLNRFFTYGLPHLSSYALTVEHKTALNTLITRKKMAPVDEGQTVSHFDLLLKETERHNFIHYEISNFAREGYYSKHNSIYWLGGHYLGIGPSAHSFNGVSRQWNVANMKQYMEFEQTGTTVLEKEVLSKDQQYNEYVMTSLRTSWGCDTEHIRNVFGSFYADYLKRLAAPFVEEGKIQRKGSVYFLTNTGKLYADGIASALFRV